MTDVIYLSSRRPEGKLCAENVMLDDEGVEMRRFILTYAFEGAKWSHHIWAYSMDDAVQRVAAMRGTLVVEGPAS